MKTRLPCQPESSRVRRRHAISAIALSLLFGLSLDAKTVPLFLSGGQSNTDGRLKADTRPDYLLAPNSNALVSAHSPYDRKRLGVFLPFAPASKADGQPGMWAYDAVVYHHLAKAIGTFYVAKTSYGGMSIDPAVNNSPSRIGIAGAVWHPEIGRGYHWSADPAFLAKTAIAGQPFEVNGTNCVGQSLFKAWMANVDAAIDAIRARGDTPDVKAVIWHQGESDRLKVSRSYEKNIKTLIAAIRAHVAEKTGERRCLALPFVCGTVPRASKGYNGRIAEALMKMNGVDHVYVIDNADLTLQRDRLHFDAPSAELFGNRVYRRLVDEGIVKEEK